MHGNLASMETDLSLGPAPAVADAGAPTVLDELRQMDGRKLSKLIKRSMQIMHPLLATAKLGGEDWFKRASDAVQFFVNNQRPTETIGKKVLKMLFRLYVSGKYPSKIWTDEVAREIYDRGLSLDHEVSYYLESRSGNKCAGTK
jgi:Protein of unknown function (DUF3631)